ncbi:MAG: hypothetical protein Q9181_000434 [Wetmoreana brouardii]
MKSKEWSRRDEQTVFDGLVRVGSHLQHMHGTGKRAKPIEVVLPRGWTGRSNAANEQIDWTWQEDVELIQSVAQVVWRRLPTEGEPQWEQIAEEACSVVPDDLATPSICCAAWFHDSIGGEMGDHHEYREWKPPRPRAPPREYPQGPPAVLHGADAIYDDPELIRTLRLYLTEQQKVQVQKSVPIKNVTRLESCYPPVKQYICGYQMTQENRKLWRDKVYGPQADPRRGPRTIEELDESRLRGIIRRGQNARIDMDGKLSLFILRNAVQNLGVLEHLGRVALDNSLQRRTCRRDDSGQIGNVGYTCGDRSKYSETDFMSVGWSKSLLPACSLSDEQLKELSLRDSCTWTLLWNIVKPTIPQEVVKDYQDVMAQYQLPRMDCNQFGMGSDFDIGILLDGQEHVLTGLEKAPPSGFAAVNYGKDIHHEIGHAKYVISLTTNSDLSVNGGQFFSADTGYMVEREANTLMVHRAEDWHGTELLDIAPTDQTPYTYGLSLGFAERLCALWPKTQRLLAEK